MHRSLRMTTGKIQTSHDLADLLEDAVKVLRMLPAMQLTETRQPIRTRTAELVSENDRIKTEENLDVVATQITKLDRRDAEGELASLTVDAIRKLAPLLDVRVPSKATKDEYIKLLLNQLFDAPAGQELIRTFHKRNERRSNSKMFVTPRRVRRLPSDKESTKDGSGTQPD